MKRFVVSAVVSVFVFAGCSAAAPSSDAGGGDAAVSLVDAGQGGGDAGVVDAGHADAGLSDAGTFDAGVPDAGPVDGGVLAQRPYQLVVPAGYSPGTAVPLVVLLHGYSATAAGQDAYFNFSDAAQRKTFLLALPQGLVDSAGEHYWNATDACCAFNDHPDDVGYLTAVIDDVKARYAVDPKRVFVVGHSNGAFMAHRMACERSDRIAAIVSLAGAVWADSAKCTPSQHVSVLQVHGTLDTVIAYAGGAVVGMPPYPGAITTVTTWANKNACTGTLDNIAGNLDLTDVLLAETRRDGFSGCPVDGAAELWTIQGGPHIPIWVSPTAWSDAVMAWLEAHARP